MLDPRNKHFPTAILILKKLSSVKKNVPSLNVKIPVKKNENKFYKS